MNILSTDSYKLSHYKFFPKDVTGVTAYIESRGYSEKIFVEEPEVVVFGIGDFISRYLTHPITTKDVEKAEHIAGIHGVPFNKEGFQRIVDVHRGLIPVEIQALPEGTVTNCGIPLVQLWNTDPELPWVASFIETALLRAIWYPTTVATISREAKKIIKHYMEITADNLDGLDFKLHDFGARGATSGESAAIGGLAHLINFKGTDTMEAVELGYDTYEEVLGFSIPATEHSVSTMYGTDEVAYADSVVSLIEQGAPMAAIVSDTYDLYNFVENVLGGSELKSRIMDLKGTLVVRPDSGDPITVTLKTIELLGEIFGYTTNSKGFKVLPSFIRMIQGDGINLRSMLEIMKNFMMNGWSIDNIAFGMGGGLLQHCDRDTLKFAQKANEMDKGVVGIGICKDPITDPGKASKKGYQTVNKSPDGVWSSVDPDNRKSDDQLLELYYSHDGVGGYMYFNRCYMYFNKFEEIRELAKV